MFGHQHEVRLAVGGAEGDVAGVPAHQLDDGDAAVALSRGANALYAGCRDEHRRGETRRYIVDHLLEIEAMSRRRALVAVAGRLIARLSGPFVRLGAVVTPQVVVDSLGG